MGGVIMAKKATANQIASGLYLEGFEYRSGRFFYKQDLFEEDDVAK